MNPDRIHFSLYLLCFDSLIFAYRSTRCNVGRNVGRDKGVYEMDYIPVLRCNKTALATVLKSFCVHLATALDKWDLLFETGIVAHLYELHLCWSGQKRLVPI